MPGSVFAGEIAEQPEVAARMLESARAEAAAAAQAIRRARPAGILVAARGSSDNAAIYMKYLLAARNRLPVALAAPSLFSLYDRPPSLEGFAVLGISQSGASPDVAGVVESARRQGVPTIAITGSPASRLGAAAEHVVRLASGRERSVPASKTYTVSLLAVAMLSQALDPDPEFERALRSVPEALEAALKTAPRLESAASLLDGDRMAVVGRGYNLATAHEVALKLMETSYVSASPFSTADFLHGPVAAVTTGFGVVVVEAAGPALGQVRAAARRLAGETGRLVTFTDRPRGAPGHAVPVVTRLPEALTPLPFAVAGQLLALAMARARGHDPDRPRQLRKVTRTR